MPKFEVYSDGASRGNPGPAAYGYVIYADGVEIRTGKKFIGKTTNNIAEYTAVLEAAKDVMLQDVSEISFFLDSELIVKQMKGEYKVKNAGLIPLKRELDEVLAGKSVTFTHVPRNMNKVADGLANQAIDEQSF